MDSITMLAVGTVMVHMAIMGMIIYGLTMVVHAVYQEVKHHKDTNWDQMTGCFITLFALIMLSIFYRTLSL